MRLSSSGLAFLQGRIIFFFVFGIFKHIFLWIDVIEWKYQNIKTINKRSCLRNSQENIWVPITYYPWRLSIALGPTKKLSYPHLLILFSRFTIILIPKTRKKLSSVRCDRHANLIFFDNLFLLRTLWFLKF